MNLLPSEIVSHANNPTKPSNIFVVHRNRQIYLMSSEFVNYTSNPAKPSNISLSDACFVTGAIRFSHAVNTKRPLKGWNTVGHKTMYGAIHSAEHELRCFSSCSLLCLFIATTLLSSKQAAAKGCTKFFDHSWLRHVK